MQSESSIFDQCPAEINETQGFFDFKLLKTTTYAMLYQASKAGKHFLIKTTKDNSEHQIEMLRREYELSIGCDHPHIVHIYTFEERLPIGAGIIMEYIEGRTLTEYMAENPTRNEREQVFRELLSAVEYMHLRSILHNDLKPDNILVTRANNRIKLIDFGLADNDAQFVMRTLGCTPQYASPELRTQSREIDARSDIYSLGVIMQELFPRRYRAVAKRACALAPHERYDNVAHLQSAWTRRRSLPRRLLIASCLLVAFLSLLLWPNFRMMPAERNYASQCEQFEEEMEMLCRQAVDSMAPIPFYNWTQIIALEYEVRLDSCRERAIRLFDDTQRRVDFETFSALRSQECKERINRAAWEGGKIYIHQTSSLSPEEREFYNSLFYGGLPYRPYCSE